MSRIKQTQKVEREVTVHVKCDVCNKTHDGNNIPKEWHGFSIHHNHWGNDSQDSYEYFDVCSPECYKSKFKECVEAFDGFTDGEIDGFEIQFATILAKTF